MSDAPITPPASVELVLSPKQIARLFFHQNDLAVDIRGVVTVDGLVLYDTKEISDGCGFHWDTQWKQIRKHFRPYTLTPAGVGRLRTYTTRADTLAWADRLTSASGRGRGSTRETVRAVAAVIINAPSSDYGASAGGSPALEAVSAGGSPALDPNSKGVLDLLREMTAAIVTSQSSQQYIAQTVADHQRGLTELRQSQQTAAALDTARFAETQRMCEELTRRVQAAESLATHAAELSEGQIHQLYPGVAVPQSFDLLCRQFKVKLPETRRRELAGQLADLCHRRGGGVIRRRARQGHTYYLFDPDITRVFLEVNRLLPPE